MPPKKGDKSKTHSGLDFETRKGSKEFDREGKREKTTSKGVKKLPYQIKGSQEAKDHMAKIRNMKKK
jgi:ribosomal protein S6